MKNESLTSFEQLKCWQACRALRMFVAGEAVRRLPAEEKYRMGDQMLRSARSTTANIAEGFGRYYYADNARFCRQARGSCTEVLDHFITAVDESLLDRSWLDKCRPLVDEAQRLLGGYIRYLLARRHDGEAPTVAEDPDSDYAQGPVPAFPDLIAPVPCRRTIPDEMDQPTATN